MSKYKIISDEEDYDFLNSIYDKYKIPKGKGIRNFIEIAINEYKINAFENNSSPSGRIIGNLRGLLWK